MRPLLVIWQQSLILIRGASGSTVQWQCTRFPWTFKGKHVKNVWIFFILNCEVKNLTSGWPHHWYTFDCIPKRKVTVTFAEGCISKATEDSWSDGWGLLNTFFINFQRPALALESRLDLSNIFVGNKKSTLYGDTFYRHIRNNFQTDNFGSHIVKSFYFLTTEGTFCVLAPDLWREIGAWFGSEKYSLCRNLTNCAKDLRNRISHLFYSFHLPYSSSLSIINIIFITRPSSSLFEMTTCVQVFLLYFEMTMPCVVLKFWTIF